MARTQTRAGDYTGSQKAKLAAEHAEEQKAAAATIALATAAAEAEEKQPVDLEPKKAEVEERLDGEVAVTDVDVNEEIVSFRVNETLESVTIGVGNNYDFEEGRVYRAPKFIYDHLEEKGLIWH